jgi:hypothetical protein
VATLTVAPADSANESGVTEAAPVSAPKASARAEHYAQMILLATLLAAPALMSLHTPITNDPDVWWHLRTGEWILQHHAVPRVDPFSGPNAGKPWPAYSWLYELLIFSAFKRFGIIALAGYTATMMFAVTVALSRLVKRLQADFTTVALLTFGGYFAMGHLFTPRPWLFTILFFVLEIDILMQVRRTGKLRQLLWLPLIFALWSNIHIQFIDGLIVLGLALAESAASARGVGMKTGLGVFTATAALAGSVLGTLMNPFGWHIYRVAYDLASQPGVLDKISELKAVPFRDITDWTVLGLTLAATVALARTGKPRIFETGLLAFATFVSFRSQRDVWVVAVAAVVILASAIPARANRNNVTLPGFAALGAGVMAVFLVIAGSRVMHVNNASLEMQIEKVYPVKAVAAIQAGHYAGPLYNSFDWGGYLIWALRMPVSMDGRAAFYGDEAINRSVVTWNAQPNWNTDPLLTKAGVVIGSPKDSLTQLLRLDRKYKLVYEDKVAAVFVPATATQSGQN